MKKNVFFLVVLLLTVSFYSCVDENDFDFNRIAQTTINPSIELNLLETQVALTDFFKIDFDSLASSVDGLRLEFYPCDTGNYWRLVYNRMDTIDMPKILDSIPILETDFNIPPLYIPGIGLGDVEFSTDLYSERINIPELRDNIRFDSATFIDGSKLRFTFSHDIQDTTGYDVAIVLNSPDIVNKYNHQAIPNDTIWLVGSKATENGNLNLSNCLLNVQRDNNDSAYFTVDYFLLINAKENANPVGDIHCNVHLNHEELFIDIAYGYLGNYDVYSMDTVFIPYFDDTNITNVITPHSINLLGFEAQMAVYSNIGIETTVWLNELSSMNSAGEIIKLIENPLPDTVINQKGALIPHQPIKINLHPFISNLYGIEALPNKIFSDVAIRFNKDRPANFVTPQDAFVAVSSEMKVPLILRIDTLIYKTEVNAFDVVKEMDYLKSLTMKFHLENMFPFQVDAEFLLCDSNGIEIEPLIDSVYRINGAVVDDNGNILRESITDRDITVTSDKYDALRKADKIQIKIMLNTSKTATGKPFVRLNLKDNNAGYLKLKLGVKATTNFTF
ncbi:MAG: hypothetical protein LBR28_02485 [Bacteroidales bacterium]|jgi:hypothetical protein|nr:hypothetical protein [Bacteroidales bacterium]